jgi:GntR family galactonate operon transcriptional repressor
VETIDDHAAEKLKASRPRVMSDITAAIAGDILSGRYEPGSSLPTEKDLGVE